MLLADIGNTHMHIYDGNRVVHLSHEEAITKYGNRVLSFISVNQRLNETIIRIENWKNISSDISLEGAYKTMGVDRRALCLSRDNGIFVDAGSAITVDVMENGVYQGGFILPGIRAYLRCYADISPVLETEINETVDIAQLPLTTKDGISYGIIASIKALIEKHHNGKQLYFTGGDGLLLSRFFDDAVFDERLVFEGMRKVIKDDKRC